MPNVITKFDGIKLNLVDAAEDKFMEAISRAQQDYGVTVVHHVDSFIPAGHKHWVRHVAGAISRQIKNRGNPLTFTVVLDNLTFVAKDFLTETYPEDVVKDIWMKQLISATAE